MTENQDPVDRAEETIIIDWATSEKGIKKVAQGDAWQKMQAEAEHAIYSDGHYSLDGWAGDQNSGSIRRQSPTQ